MSALTAVRALPQHFVSIFLVVQASSCSSKGTLYSATTEVNIRYFLVDLCSLAGFTKTAGLAGRWEAVSDPILIFIGENFNMDRNGIVQ